MEEAVGDETAGVEETADVEDTPIEDGTVEEALLLLLLPLEVLVLDGDVNTPDEEVDVAKGAAVEDDELPLLEVPVLDSVDDTPGTELEVDEVTAVDAAVELAELVLPALGL